MLAAGQAIAEKNLAERPVFRYVGAIARRLNRPSGVVVVRARIRQWRRPGATLIELLVVVALIGMLVSMLVPSLKSSMNLAAATICKHNLREIGHAITMYQIENDGWLPATGPVDFGDLALHKTEPWFAKLYPNYLDDPQIFACPEDPYGFRMTDVGNRLSEPEVADYASFGINGFIMSSAGGALARIDRRPPSRPHRCERGATDRR